MDLSVPSQTQTELAAAYLQLAVTLGLVVLCGVLHRRYRKEYFGLWAVAWAIYGLRLVAIVTFLRTGASAWLFWHQVTTGWTALALLWAALVFSQRVAWRPAYALLALFPLVWSYLAIYVLDSFVWAAGPMVAFLSVTTAWTAYAFLRYDRLVRSPAARFLVGVLVLWALHHLDYPFLRARGAWSPWGYYLDIVFEIGMGLGILFLVLEDLDQGLRTLTALSGELQPRAGHEETMTEAMLRRALALRGVHGSALWLTSSDGGVRSRSRDRGAVAVRGAAGGRQSRSQAGVRLGDSPGGDGPRRAGPRTRRLTRLHGRASCPRRRRGRGGSGGRRRGPRPLHGARQSVSARLRAAGGCRARE